MRLLLLFFLLLLAVPAAAWPYVFDLAEGETHAFSLGEGKAKKNFSVQLQGVEYSYEPNLWVEEKWGKQTLREAKVTLLVGGKRLVLLQRPYESPVTFGGLRLYVENTRRWAREAELDAMEDFPKEVRLAVTLEGEPWGPPELRFPIADYRWRSAVYQNTWSSLVPYNLLYYHRGDDFGAIPDQLDVRAVLPGKVMVSPGPTGDGKSNSVVIANSPHFQYRLSHMNTEHVRPEVKNGAEVPAGAVLAKTGSTWAGARNQKADPHLHVNFDLRGQAVSTFPFLTEAYFREYPDQVMAIAGAYLNALPGQPVELDGSRSLARPRQKIKSYTWKLHDGSTVKGARTSLTIREPGLYTQELVVQTADGSEDRDFVQVRVWGNVPPTELTYGWAYHYPVRGIKPGTEVQVWNRLVRPASPVMVDFGDGSPVRPAEPEMTHHFQKPGIYTVTLSTTGTGGEPVTVKMKVAVEK
jgi:murein DD-endopeptidase MepM/ murein hydrolase activator NlpD